MQSNSNSCIKEKFPLSAIPQKVAAQLEELRKNESPLAIACSGGADSVFLVRWVLAHFPQSKRKITVLHFNHATRDAESDKDELFIHDFAEKLGLKVITGKRNESERDNCSEDALRSSRMAFMHKSMVSQGIKNLLTGHHLQDKVETLLMRLSRASTLDALMAPAPIHTFRNGITHIRPLIPFHKVDLIDALIIIGQKWREDASNQNNNYYRNIIRNKLLPIWTEACPQKLYENIARTCSLLQEDADALNKWAESTVQSIDIDSKKYPLSQQKMIPLAINRRCLWMWFNHQGISDNLSFSMIESLVQAVPGQRITLSDHDQVTVNDAGDLVLEKRVDSIKSYDCGFYMPMGSKLFFPGHHCLQAEVLPATNDHIASICSGNDNPESLVHLDFHTSGSSTGITIAFWQPGMQYQPLGLGTHKKLQDCFINRKVPRNKRNLLPVIRNNNDEILWVPGLIPTETARVHPQSKSLLRLTYLRS